tara:strand:- start:2150 stop:3139 length:990 start_codon:yes stop_codon:yes gene_type:complete
VKFIDQAKITVRAGKGGDGISAFRREKYVPAGGPSGGDGGAGGKVIFVADANLQTLLDFKYKQVFQAEDGMRGGPNKKSGASGKDILLKVPPGTEVSHYESGVVFGDLVKHGETLIAAFGGRGGAGNARYLSNKNRAPEKFKEGEYGEEWDLKLELKLIADVGIIGLPNAGKSTLISTISSAKPKVADYPFTTLIPNLGVVRKPSGDGVLFADIPGLISGAAAGVGLGHDFLRHIKRTKLLIHVVDSSSLDPLEDIKSIEKELVEYGDNLCDKSRIIVLNKKDLLNHETEKYLLENIKSNTRLDVLITSGVTKDGVEDMLNSVWSYLKK